MNEITEHDGQKVKNKNFFIIIFFLIIFVLLSFYLFFINKVSDVTEEKILPDLKESVTQQRAQIFKKLYSSLLGSVWEVQYSEGKLKTAVYTFNSDTVDIEITFINGEKGNLNLFYTYKDGHGQFGRQDQLERQAVIELQDEFLFVTQASGEKNKFTLLNPNILLSH